MKAIKHFSIFLLLSLAFSVSAQLTWTQKANFSSGRYEDFGVSLGNCGYIGTGYSTSQQSDFRQYNVVTDSWTQKQSLATARDKATAFSINAYVYVGLGYYSSVLNDFWKYDTTANTWSAIAQFPGSSRASASSFVIGNYAYVGLGQVSVSSYLSDFYRYDPQTNTWTSVASFPGGVRCGAFSFAINGKGYVGCGYSNTGTPIYYGDFWEYDPIANTWTQKADFAGGPRWYGVGLTVGNRGYAGTGLNSTTTYFSDLWQYTPSTNSWQLMNTPDAFMRWAAASFSIGNKGYIGTGYYSTSVLLNDLWEFVPFDVAITESHNSEVNVSIINNQLHVFGIKSSDIIKNIRLVEPSGKQIKQWKYEEGAVYDVSQFSSGIYLVQIEMNSGNKVVKLMK